jgi:hypothetical protein
MGSGTTQNMELIVEKFGTIQELLNHLHTIQLDMIDEAVLKSNLEDANLIIKHIMELPNA